MAAARRVSPTRPIWHSDPMRVSCLLVGAAGVVAAIVGLSPGAAGGSAATGRPLPLHFRTHNATKVITVTAQSRGSTTARLQAWSKAAGGGWFRHGRSVVAHVGSDGLSTQASESLSATPIGSFTLTHAFGHYVDPGTRLPYLHTGPADWWISQAGPLYNTHQRCSSGCSFRQGSPNEHLYYETPYYNYAVVIDYNTRNSPTGVVQGRGSAFFLHVHPTGTGATAGCVSIPQAKLVRLMRWLNFAAHPRILIGVG
jgi:L,D-peptidoglycan transpeptidase YkuD (ErfK/YbiS/YcfS/YnhG family)